MTEHLCEMLWIEGGRGPDVSKTQIQILPEVTLFFFFFFYCWTTLAFCEIIQWVREQTAGSYYGSAAWNPNLVFDSIMLRRDWTVILLHDRAAEMKRCECEQKGWQAKGCGRVRRGDKWRSREGEREEGWMAAERKKKRLKCVEEEKQRWAGGGG